MLKRLLSRSAGEDDSNSITLDESLIKEKNLSINGLGNKVFVNGMVQSLNVSITGSGNTLRVGANCNLNVLSINFTGDNNTIEIEDKVSSDRYIDIFMLDNDSTVSLGKKSSFVGVAISLADNGNSCIIGKDCMFGGNILILPSDFHSIVSLETGERINPSKGIYIGDHVWVGEAARILKNTTIGKDAIIAAQALIVKDVPANCIAGGNPGRILREGVTWTRERL